MRSFLAIASVAILLSVGFIVALLVYYATPLPAFDVVKGRYQISEGRLFDRRGELIQEVRLSKRERRIRWEPLNQLPKDLVDTVISTEDKRFYNHSGVDWLALGSSGLGWLSGNRRGASTISMQVVTLINPKRFSRHKSLTMKIRQLVQALQLERTWSKNQILEAYFNLVSFRGELIGVASATGGLFGKYPQGLTRNEIAILASLIRAPQAGAAELSKRACLVASKRWNDSNCQDLSTQVAGAIAQNHSMPVEAALAPQAAVKIFTQARLNKNLEDVIVESTLDSGLQRFAVDLLKRKLIPLANRNVHDGAILVADNSTGDILAYVGNAGSASSKRFVDGVLAKRQAGSTLKPFLYALAFEQKVLTPASELDDNPTEFPIFGGLYRPRNYDKQFHGKVSVRTALASSMNVVAVKTLDMLGVEAFLEKLKALGISQLREADFYGVSLALGSANVSLWELVNAYRTLANKGAYTALRLAKEDDVTSLARRIYSEDSTFLVSDILSDRQSRAMAFGLENPLSTPYWSAVKTGTSRDMVDNWCIGFSKRYTVGVWVGNFSGEPMWNVSGVTGAATIWNELMDYMERDTGVSLNPEVPPNIVKADLPGGSSEYFIRGTEAVFQPHDSAAEEAFTARITYPAQDTVFAMDPDIPAGRQLIPIQVSPPNSDTVLALDGNIVSTQDMPYLWQPLPGKHHATLRDKMGVTRQDVTFTVRGY